MKAETWWQLWPLLQPFEVTLEEGNGRVLVTRIDQLWLERDRGWDKTVTSVRCDGRRG